MKDNQNFIKDLDYGGNEISDFIDDYLEFKSEPDFMNKYQFIQHQKLCFLNKMLIFYNAWDITIFLSQLLSLLAPILGIIVPYFVLLFKGIVMPINNI